MYVSVESEVAGRLNELVAQQSVSAQTVDRQMKGKESRPVGRRLSFSEGRKYEADNNAESRPLVSSDRALRL
jgi:hypothetical protein